MGPYKNLTVWQKSMSLAKEIYAVTASYPQREIYGLVNQMRRCVVSIPSNIAEGYGRGSNRDLVHFLYISLGSSNELETQLLLSQEFGYITDEKSDVLMKLNGEVNKMLSSLIYKRTLPAASNFTLRPEISQGTFSTESNFTSRPETSKP